MTHWICFFMGKMKAKCWVPDPGYWLVLPNLDLSTVTGWTKKQRLLLQVSLYCFNFVLVVIRPLGHPVKNFINISCIHT
jgi:hypothetical protein